MTEDLPKKFEIIMVIDGCPIEIHLKKKTISKGNYSTKIIEYHSASKALDYLTDSNNSSLLPQLILG